MQIDLIKWDVLLCRCPLGQEAAPAPDVCVGINECKDDPCVHGECVDLPVLFECRCYPGYEEVSITFIIMFRFYPQLSFYLEMYLYM